MSSLPFHKSWLFLVLLGAWGTSLLCAGRILWQYDTKSQNQENDTAQRSTWPKKSGLVRPAEKYVVLMFVHPKCPCSIASLDELNVIMNSDAGKFGVAYVIFVPERGADDSWSKGNYSWIKAGGIPHVIREIDRDQKETRLFEAKISGYTLVFDPEGRSQFAGGITAERGHGGDNLGRDIVMGVLESKPQSLHTHALFGCELPVFTQLK